LIHHSTVQSRNSSTHHAGQLQNIKPSLAVSCTTLRAENYLAAFAAGFAAGVDLTADVAVFIAAEASAETSLPAAIITSAVSI
jgi:hypothetical protein